MLHLMGRRPAPDRLEIRGDALEPIALWMGLRSETSELKAGRVNISVIEPNQSRLSPSPPSLPPSESCFEIALSPPSDRFASSSGPRRTG